MISGANAEPLGPREIRVHHTALDEESDIEDFEADGHVLELAETRSRMAFLEDLGTDAFKKAFCNYLMITGTKDMPAWELQYITSLCGIPQGHTLMRVASAGTRLRPRRR